MTSLLTARRVRFEYPPDTRPGWNPRRPECAFAANGISLLMPYAEPYFVRTTKAAMAQLEPEQRAEAEAYVRQEASHHAQHRRFNDLLVGACPRLARVERWIEKAYGWLGRTRSLRFSLAFAASSETIAFSLARWAEKHLSDLFEGADPVPASLFLWHLAEEVEHKSVAFDIWEALDGKRRRYVLAMTISLVLLGLFTWAAALTQLASTKRFFNPLSHVRLALWAVGLAFTVLPDLAVSARRSHHPSQFTDPILLAGWLRSYDVATGTMPLWAVEGLTSRRSAAPVIEPAA